ncbi:MAG: hypothetical protein J6Y20_05685 [Lachnospiraceae bacterium]|nr:hypothetical protein [Lachnospiraceae bacterium]
MAECYLTTVDNHYDPTIDFDAWHFEDIRLGHDTCGKLARIAQIHGWSDELSDERQSAIIEDSIDELIDCDFLNIYRKITKEKVKESS